jgi:hypothetical protein
LRSEESGRAARCVAILATQYSRVWLASLSNYTSTAHHMNHCLYASLRYN